MTAEHLESGYQIKWNGKIIDRAGAGTYDGSQPLGSSTGANIVYPNLNFAGLQRKAATLQTAQSQMDPSWRGTVPGLRYDDLSETTFNLGDPRAAYFMGPRQAAVAYAKRPSDGSSGSPGNSSWWGRVYQTNLVAPSSPPQKWFAAQTLVSNWPDGDHTDNPWDLACSYHGRSSFSSSSAPPPEPSKAPIYISNAGAYKTVTELGHIYDPIQWRPIQFHS